MSDVYHICLFTAITNIHMNVIALLIWFESCARCARKSGRRQHFWKIWCQNYQSTHKTLKPMSGGSKTTILRAPFDQKSERRSENHPRPKKTTNQPKKLLAVFLWPAGLVYWWENHLVLGAQGRARFSLCPLSFQISKSVSGISSKSCLLLCFWWASKTLDSHTACWIILHCVKIDTSTLFEHSIFIYKCT